MVNKTSKDGGQESLATLNERQKLEKER